MKEWTGRGIDRLDARAKVTGKAVYSAEVPVANVAHAVIVGSSVARGRIRSLDAARARAAPGVLAVITHENAPKLELGRKNETGERVLSLLDGDAVRHDGQPIAVVVADTLERARHAASLVVPEYQKETPSVRLEDEIARVYTPARVVRDPPDSNRGDFDAAFASAPARVEATYVTPPDNHNPMEMHATIAVWQGADRLTLYDSTQGIFSVRARIARLFGLKPENVRVICWYLGGGFGCKGSPWSHVPLAAMAAKVAGRPVKLVLTRQQMFEFVGFRPKTIQSLALGANKDGTLLAIKHDVVTETSRFDEFVEGSATTTRMLYACPSVRTSHRVARLDIATPTFTRAPGKASGNFALECAMDELSYAVGVDPLALRLKNYAARDPDSGKPWSSKELRACYAEAARRFGWAKRPAAPRSLKEGRLLVGYGMATATYPAGLNPASAEARLHADGSAQMLSGSHDLGTGTYTIMTQIAADALALPIEKVRFELGDTVLPEAPLAAGSRTAASVGSAVKLAGLELRKRLAELCVADARSPLHGLPPERLKAEDGELFDGRDPKKRDAYAAILERAGKKELSARVDAKEKEERKAYSTHAFGAQFAEVRVDEELGIVRLSRMVGAFAVGKVLNAKTLRSQFLGGMVWAIGLALEEVTERDRRSGRVVTRDLVDYHVPVNLDVPELDVILVDEVDPYVSEVGAKGAGEIGITGGAAAIANAVYHATGKRVRELPITLDKLLGA